MTNKLFSEDEADHRLVESHIQSYKAGTLKSIKLPHTPHLINITELDSLLDGALLDE